MGTGSHRSKHTIFFGFAPVAIAMLFFVLATAGSAQAADKPFSLSFSQSSIKVGLLPGVPLDQVGSGASIEGTIDDSGNITVPKEDFKLPMVNVGSAIQGLTGLEIPIGVDGFMGIEQDATGTFDRATGKLELQAQAGVWVSINVKQVVDALATLGIDIGNVSGLPINLGSLGTLTCGFAPMDVTFTTEGTTALPGERFTEGLKGPGSIVAQWSQLGPLSGRGSIPLFGSLELPASFICRALPPLIESTLASTIGGVIPGLEAFDLGFIFDNLDNLNLGPSSLTLSKAADKPPVATTPRLRMKIVPRRLRPLSRGTVYRISVRNVGRRAASKTKVCARARRGAVRGTRCFRLGAIAPGRSKRATFRLSIARKAPSPVYRVSFRMRASGGASSARSAWLIRGFR